MSSGAEPGRHIPAGPTAEHRARHGWISWRLAAPLVFVLTGVLFVASAHNSEGTDLREGRYTDLASLVSNESRQVSDLKREAAALQTEVDRLADGVQNQAVRRLQQKAERQRHAAGFTEVTGPALQITLSDAPADVINSSTQKVDRMIVHQQDIQAVVNALWNGGATGITIQGQRVISTTGIKCEGNAVQLDGVPYGQPYVIVAVGDLAALAQAIDADSYVQTYIEDSRQPDIAVGWELTALPSVTLPAYTGLRDLHYAQVAAS
ncbi:MAG: DUF881 domain-containing protein [Nocardioides sp.]|uniref:DUF881 domain-containing protein n=1 Tax=Nocardioides sp. TaxID=35761 RepID=UPI0039E4629D